MEKPKQTAANQKSRVSKTIAASGIAVFVLLLVFLGVFVCKPLLSTLGEPETFRAWVDERGAWGEVLFVGMIALQVIVAFIPAEPMEIAAGYAFGAVWGTILVWIGLIIGTTVVFVFVKLVGVRAVEAFFPREKIDEVRFLKNEKRLNATAFFLFLIPGTPKDLLTYCAGLTKIRFVPWILLTSIARFPSIITSTVGGNALGTQNYTFAVIVFAATAVVATAGGVIYYFAEKKRSRKEALAALAFRPLPVPDADAGDALSRD